MLYRGTTPYHSFILPLSTSSIDEIYITYWQNGEVKVEYGKNDITLRDLNEDNGWISDTGADDSLIENNTDSEEESKEISYSQAIVHLTQQDTLKFDFYPAAEKNIVAIQVRLLTTDGEAFASEVARERVYGVLMDGVI